MNLRYRVDLEEGESAQLAALVAGGSRSVRRVKRAQILLAAAGGQTDAAIATTVQVGTSTVYRTKRRCVEESLEAALAEDARPGGQRKLTGAEEALLIATACSAPPRNRAVLSVPSPRVTGQSASRRGRHPPRGRGRIFDESSRKGPITPRPLPQGPLHPAYRLRQVFGREPKGVFRSAENLRPVSMDDEGDSHDALNVYASICRLPPALSSHLRTYTYALVAREISRVTRYADRVIHVDPLAGDSGALREAIDAPSKIVSSLRDLAGVTSDGVSVILFNGNFNHSTDVQGLLETIRPEVARGSRVVVALYNWYFAWLYRLADRFGIRQGSPISTFLTQSDLAQLARLSGFELVRLRPVAYLPWHFCGIGTLVNAIMPAIPGLRWLSFVTVAVLRPVAGSTQRRPSLSVVIPARNERGNIEAALERMPNFGAATEVIFVEGHSTDGTWEEIQRVSALWDGRHGLRVRALQQQAKGKADAVRLGFAQASGEVLTILDADLTMPPERLTRFYEAYREGAADFVNGTRLVYPMEGEAMRLLNHLANVFFAKMLSFVLDARLGDSLCGTKLVSRNDYERFVRWRKDFGDFDPFGDFELLFPAAVLGTGIIDIPVDYRARTYGTTNIRRFRDGFTLLRMTMTGLWRIKFGSF